MITIGDSVTVTKVGHEWVGKDCVVSGKCDGFVEVQLSSQQTMPEPARLICLLHRDYVKDSRA